jgi:hypothetical protein
LLTTSRRRGILCGTGDSTMPNTDPTSLNPLLCFRDFADGSTRPVYLDAVTGKQYVLDDQGEPLYDR